MFTQAEVGLTRNVVGWQVLVARKYVEEEVLTSKCPRCRTAFLDFEGCCALKCSRCPCQFCAWCEPLNTLFQVLRASLG